MMEAAVQPTTLAPATPTVPGANPYNRRQQLLQELLKHNELLLKNRLEVRHLMTCDPAIVAPTTTCEEMALIVQQRRLHHLLVCNRGGEVLGVVNDRDLVAQRGTTAQQLMTSPVPTVAPETLLNPAITYLINENVSCLPVVENGRLCGILTTTDLVLALQCMLQLWLRLTQVIQPDAAWTKEFDKIAAALGGPLTAAQLAQQTALARDTLQQQVRDLLSAIDLRADVLTSMSNRRGMEEVLDMLMAVQRQFGQPLALAVVVIDHFQHISDSCGAAVAKPLVKAVARLIEQSAGDSDYVARWRDDAFAVVMPQRGAKEAETFCCHVRQTAQQDKELAVKLRISAGAVSAEPGETVAQLLDRAEAAAT
jgi:diguanylate cyclase (GGDEF)-like protein